MSLDLSAGRHIPQLPFMIPAFAFSSLNASSADLRASFNDYIYFFSKGSVPNYSTLTSDQSAPFFDPSLVPLIQHLRS
jgi:hypothetical protein